MNILFDLRGVQLLLRRGIGRYIEGLLEKLILNQNLKISFLISGKAEYPSFIKEYSKISDTYVFEIFDQYDIKTHFDFYIVGTSFFLDYIDSNASKIDLVFPKNVIKHCDQKVLILYDLITMDYVGEFMPDFQSKLNFLRYFEALQWFDHFFTISLFTKQDALRFMKRNKEEDFTPIWGGANENLYRQCTYNPAERKNDVVDISGDHIGKNYVNLSIAFAKAYTSGKIPQDARLFLICKCGEQYKKNIENAISKFGLTLGKNIIATNYISDEEMIDIISSSRALIHPAYIEGLGLPVLEAYAIGTPAFGSNCSAIKEFIMPEASFDPTDSDEIANKIIELYNDNDLCVRTFNFGQNLLKIYTWQNAANIVYDTLCKLKKRQIVKLHKNAIFLAGSGACAETAVQIYSERHDKFDIFVDVKNFAELDHLRSLHKKAAKIVFPIESFEDACKYTEYDAKLFEIGSSQHHKRVFDLACKTSDEENRYLILPDATAVWGLYHTFDNNMETLLNAVSLYYPEYQIALNGITEDKLLPYLNEKQIVLLRILINSTKIKKIISFTEKNTEFMLNELKDNTYKDLDIFTLKLPVNKIREKVQPYYHSKDFFLVGVFGTPSENEKRTNDIIIAVRELIKEGMNIKLLIAGQGVSSNYINEDFIILEENPDRKKWLSLMASVDVGVQLREKSLANSSGCISELLGLDKTVITTQGILNDDSEYVFTLPEKASTDMIKEKIRKALNAGIHNTPFKSTSSFYDTATAVYDYIADSKKEKS